MKTQAFFVLTMTSFKTVTVKGWPMYQPKPKARGAAPVICPWSGSWSQQGTVQMQSPEPEDLGISPQLAAHPLRDHAWTGDRFFSGHQLFSCVHWWMPSILLNTVSIKWSHAYKCFERVPKALCTHWKFSMCVGVFSYVVLLPVEAAFPSLRFKNAVIFPSDYLKDCVYITVLLSCSFSIPPIWL